MHRYEDSLCACGCGFPSAVSQAPENEDRFRVELPIRCHARSALVLAQRSREKEDDLAPEALLWETPQLVPQGLHVGGVVAEQDDGG